MSDEERGPLPYTISRREVDGPILAWERDGETSRRRIGEDDVIELGALPLYIREKVNPATLVEQLRRSGTSVQANLLDDFNGLPPDADTYRFYEHTGHWQNRLVHGIQPRP